MFQNEEVKLSLFEQLKL